MKYYVTIGIEIHCELKTNTKMFSSAPVRFGETANTCVNAIDLAHPGTLPWFPHRMGRRIGLPYQRQPFYISY